MIDLHTHSTFSDGSCSPTELVRLASKIGLSAIALTDHNTISGLEEFKKAGKEYNIETVSGIEFSTETNNEDFHIIALFVKSEYYNSIENFVITAIDNKIKSNKILVNNLNHAGFDISYEQIVNNNGSENFNRVAIAKELKEKGHVQSIKEAFNGLLHEKTGYYIPPKRLDTYETIKFINSIGAVSVWAHPLKDTSFEKLNNLYLPKAKRFGLVAIETMHSSYTEQQTEDATKLAMKYNLLSSGGSDFHGENKENILLGTGYENNVCISNSILDWLKEHIK